MLHVPLILEAPEIIHISLERPTSLQLGAEGECHNNTFARAKGTRPDHAPAYGTSVLIYNRRIENGKGGRKTSYCFRISQMQVELHEYMERAGIIHAI